MLLALTEIQPLHWAAFVAAVLFFLALDLGVFHRRAHVVSFQEALGWTALWASLALLFAYFVAPKMAGNWGPKDTDEFVTGYLIELSLSMDNVFVIALIFSYFKVPVVQQHRVLFWGILGALVMRGALIWGGAALIHRFEWLLYGLGAFLVFSGLRMLFVDGDGVDLEKNRIVRLSRRYLPFSDRFDGPRFMTTLDGRRLFTPLFLVLIIVETTDLVFAVDSIPAIFGITKNPFIVFTSNVFAILGLRSLYFVLAGAIGCFRYLKHGLSVVLVFIGGKMLAEIWGAHLEARYSLYVVLGILAVSVVASWAAGSMDRRKKAGHGPNPPPSGTS